MYRVRERFADLTDNKYLYEAGDKFPRIGLKVSKERIEELKSGNNLIGKAVIEEVKEERKKKRNA